MNEQKRAVDGDGYTHQDVSELKEWLLSSPKKERKLTKAEAIDLMAEDLKKVRDEEHYTLADLVERLALKNFKTHPRAISEAIGRLDAAKPARGRKSKRKAGETPAGGEDGQMRRQLEAAGQQRLPT